MRKERNQIWQKIDKVIYQIWLLYIPAPPPPPPPSFSPPSLPSRLLQQALTYTTKLTQARSHSKDEASGRFWEAMIRKTCDIIDGVVSLLPLNSFLTILHQLLSQSEGKVQRKAMNILNSKLEDNETKFTDNQVSIIFGSTITHYT